MAFIKRLGWYLLGLSVGLIFLVFFLKKKSEETGTEFCYLPNCRVLKDMRAKKFVVAPSLQQQLNEYNLDSLEIRSFLEDGAVDFSKSDTEASPCKKYLVEKKIGDQHFALTFQNCEAEVVLEEVSPAQ